LRDFRLRFISVAMGISGLDTFIAAGEDEDED
jgi:hypothetical protein